jgi:hypothetical protein
MLPGWNIRGEGRNLSFAGSTGSNDEMIGSERLRGKEKRELVWEEWTSRLGDEAEGASRYTYI